MSINSILKREGIEIIEKLDTLTINTIAHNIAGCLSASFPNLDLNANELFIQLSRLNMYSAKLPEGISAKYFYKNTSIYFDYHLDKTQLTDVALHECIHYLQEKRDNRGNIVKLGLCDYTDAALPGVGLNEAAVQLMAAKALDMPYETEKYFDISINTNTPTYYPLECALVAQMAYLIGEDVLFDSTLNANSHFKDQYISLTSDKDFYTIQKNIDLLIDLQEKLNNLYIKFNEPVLTENKLKTISKEIDERKLKIKELFLKTQTLIFTSYFDSTINLTFSPAEIEHYRNRLYLFKNYVSDADGYTAYNDYYINKMSQLEKRYDINPHELTSLATVPTGFLSRLFAKLKLLFRVNLGMVKDKSN